MTLLDARSNDRFKNLIKNFEFLSYKDPTDCSRNNIHYMLNGPPCI